MQLDILRNTVTIASPEIDEKTIFTKKLMNDHKIHAEFYTDAPLGLELGDYIEHDGEVFTMNRTPYEKKDNTKKYLNKINFEGVIYQLYRKLMMWGGLADFHYTGTASDFLNLIISNINTVSSGWSAGTVDSTNEKTIYFESHNCRTALTKIAEEFELEFALSGKQITLKKNIGEVKLYTFEYGRGKGLYSLERNQVDSQNVVTRVYGFGSTENIPFDYRDRAKRLIFDDAGKPYLEKNVNLFGVIEAQFTDDTIKPQRTGTVTAVGIDFGDLAQIPPKPAEFYIEDSSLDFDLKEHLLEGEQAQIVFKTGDMATYEFDIRSNYDHTNKRIYFKQYADADGYVLPREADGEVPELLPKTGDAYTLVNIKMPQTYVDAAELELKNKTQDFIDQNSTPMVNYSFDADPRYIKAQGISLDVGDMVTIKDTAMNIDELIRATEIKYPLVTPYAIKATIADFVPYTTEQKAIKTAINAKKGVYTVYKKSAEDARRNTARLNALASYLLDQDGEFTAPINPISVKTLLLTVGATASNFRLNGATFEDNYGGDVNALKASACDLMHLEAETESGDYSWVIPAAEFSGLTAGEAYYLYGKCSTSSLTGSWILTTDVKPSNPGDGFFYFGVGVLLPVDSKTLVRSFLSIYGKTYINGREIITGIVQSIDGLTYFDLDAGEIGGNIKFRNSSGNYEDINDLEGRVTTTETSIDFLNGQIALKVNQTTHDTLAGRVSTAETDITQNAYQISLKASQTEVNTLTGDVESHTTDITQNAYQITLKASQSSLNTLSNEVDDKVDENEVVSKINITPEVIKIQANRIETSDITVLGNVEAGSFNLGNGNFIVDSNGYVTAVGATIKSSAGTKYVEINSLDNEIKFHHLGVDGVRIGSNVGGISYGIELGILGGVSFISGGTIGKRSISGFYLKPYGASSHSAASSANGYNNIYYVNEGGVDRLYWRRPNGDQVKLDS